MELPHSDRPDAPQMGGTPGAMVKEANEIIQGPNSDGALFNPQLHLGQSTGGTPDGRARQLHHTITMCHHLASSAPWSRWSKTVKKFGDPITHLYGLKNKRIRFVPMNL